MVQAAVLGGLVAALTDALPLLNLINCLCCLGIALGGVTAVLYLRANGVRQPLNMPILIQLGLMTGIAGALIDFAFQYIVFQMLGNWQIEWLRNMLENMDEIPPAWEEIYNQLQSPEFEGFAGWGIFIRSLIIFPLFTFLGGVITNQWIKKKKIKNRLRSK